MENIIGRKFNDYTILEHTGSDKHGRRQFKCRCDCGTIALCSIYNLKKNKQKQCKKCYSKKQYEEIKKIFLNKGCELLDKEYFGAKYKLKYKCVCGRNHTKTLNNFRRYHECQKCQIDKMRLSYDYVKQYFYDNNCVLLESTYINANTKMEYKCFCGNISQIRFMSFKNGNRCRKCMGKKISERQMGEKSPMWNPDREKVEKHHKFRVMCKNLINRSLRNTKNSKTTNTYKILGYTPEELYTHLENHPNWPNCKNKNWVVDHIFPIKAFADYNIFDIKLINSLENLQPLGYNENSSKRAKYNKNEFEEFLRRKGILKLEH